MTRPDDTFELAWSRAGLTSDGDASATLSRRRDSSGDGATGLPALRVDEREGGAADLVAGERLGQGGMGVVDAAREPALDRVVAIKRPREGTDGRAATALVAEARVLAALDHPNVVPVHRLGQDPRGGPVVVMKRVVGQRWSDLAAGGADLDRDLRVALEVTDALRFAHARGILHRDVKADNVMVGDFGEVYLMDWGCACAAPGAVTREVVGTPLCMAPEMTRIGAPLSPATDVYLLGATLQRVITGRPRNPGVTLKQAMEHAWLATAAPWPPGTPPELASIIDRACAPDPDERFPTAAALAQALRGFLAHRDAARIAASASALLAPLQAAIEARGAEADALFAQCRFGHKQALEAWPECPEARTGLDRALRLFVPFKLAMGEPSTVEALLADAEPTLAEAWATEAQVIRQRKAEMEAKYDDFDLSIGARDRRNMVGGALVLGALVAMGVSALKPAGELGPGHLVGLGVAVIVIALVTIAPVWRQVLGHKASRAIALGMLAVATASLLSRVASWIGRTPTELTHRTDCLLYAVGFALLGLTVDWRLALAAAPQLAAVGALLAWPQLADAFMPMAMVMSVSIVFAIASRLVRRG